MPFNRGRSHCETCPLRDRPRVPGGGSLESKVAVCGESPGSEEAEAGKPFIGPAGRILDAGLRAAKLPRETVYTFNLINCQPPRNDLGSFEGLQALDCCKPGLDDEVAWLREHGIKVIIAAGAHPASAFGVEGGITKKRGSVYEGQGKAAGLYLVPTFHPSYINRMRWGSGDSRKDLEWTWISDLKKAGNIARDGWHPPVESFILSPSLSVVEDGLARRGRLVSVDIETTSLRPALGSVVVIGLGFSPSEALVIPFRKQGGAPYWRPLEEVDIIHKLNAFFAGNQLVFQNALFDVRFLQGAGFMLPWSSVAHDTMLLHHVVAPEMPHGLDFIVSMYGTTPYWKEAFRAREGKILEMSDDTLRRYNARDCVVLHQILTPLLEDAKALGVGEIYTDESLALLPVIAGMMDAGIRVDVRRLAQWKAHLKERYHELEETLRSTGALPPTFNLASDEDIRWYLYRTPPDKFKRLVDLPTKRRGTKVHEQLTSLQAIKDETHPIYLLRGFKGRRTDTGKVAVNKQGILSFQMALQNRLADVAKLTTPRPDEAAAITKLLAWLMVFSQWNEVEKMLSTYSDFPIEADGRIHPSFKIHGTSTGRLSSGG